MLSSLPSILHRALNVFTFCLSVSCASARLSLEALELVDPVPDRAYLTTHVPHLLLDLREERLKLGLLVGHDLFQEYFILLDDGFVVREILLLHEVVEDARLFLLECGKELSHFLSVMESRRSCLVEHGRELTDAAKLLAWALADSWLDDALGDSAANLHHNVGEALDAARVLRQQPPREL